MEEKYKKGSSVIQTVEEKEIMRSSETQTVEEKYKKRSSDTKIKYFFQGQSARSQHCFESDPY